MHGRPDAIPNVSLFTEEEEEEEGGGESRSVAAEAAAAAAAAARSSRVVVGGSSGAAKAPETEAARSSRVFVVDADLVVTSQSCGLRASIPVGLGGGSSTPNNFFPELNKRSTSSDVNAPSNIAT